MTTVGLSDMLRLLDEEELVLTNMHRKVSDELHRLQVEEEMFLRTLEKLGRNHLPVSKDGGKTPDVNVDRELYEALKEVLTEGGNDAEDELYQRASAEDGNTVEDKQMMETMLETRSS